MAARLAAESHKHTRAQGVREEASERERGLRERVRREMQFEPEHRPHSCSSSEAPAPSALRHAGASGFWTT